MSISLRLLCQFAASISSRATKWSHILQFCILQTMGNIFWPHVAKKNNLSEPHIQRPLYIWTHTWTVCSTVHTTAKTVGAIWEACTKTRVSKEEEGWMLYTVGFCMAPLGKLDLLLTYCTIHMRTDVQSLGHSPVIENILCGPSSGYGVTYSFQWPLVNELIVHPPEKKDPCNTYEAFVLPVSLQLRIIVSLRSWGPVICHPWSPKGG